MTFYVGQKVTFVGFGPRLWRHRLHEWIFPIPGPHPQKKVAYTIVRVYRNDDGLYLSLFELPEVVDPHWGEGWCSDGFRPIVEKKTDISVFAAMLKSKQRSKELCDND